MVAGTTVPSDKISLASITNAEPLCTIGAHTRHHYNLKALPTEGDVVQEIKEGVDILHSHGIDASVFAYPFGSPNEVGEREEKVLAGMQFTNAFLACGEETKRRSYKRYALPRLMLTEEYANGLLDE